MASFDPTLRREVWMFQKLGVDTKDRPIYRRMGFNLVEYDGNPEMYIEPVNAGGYGVDLTNPNVATTNNVTQEAGAIVDMRFFDARPYEVHSFGDPISGT